MKGFIVLKRLSALSIGLALSFTGYAGAQEHNLPTMNSVGRFFGIGWSHGYHAGNNDGRFQHVKEKHPASMYGSNSLHYPYHPGYQPQPAYMPTNPAYAQPVYNSLGDSQSFGSVLPGTSNPVSPTPAPKILPKPIERPPTWLRPFLKDGEKGGTEEIQKESGTNEQRENVDAIEASPSDLLKPKLDSIKPKNQKPPKTSDDDDLLTLAPKTPLQLYYEARRNQESKR